MEELSRLIQLISPLVSSKGRQFIQEVFRRLSKLTLDTNFETLMIFQVLIIPILKMNLLKLCIVLSKRNIRSLETFNLIITFKINHISVFPTTENLYMYASFSVNCI